MLGGNAANRDGERQRLRPGAGSVGGGSWSASSADRGDYEESTQVQFAVGFKFQRKRDTLC